MQAGKAAGDRGGREGSRLLRRVGISACALTLAIAAVALAGGEATNPEQAAAVTDPPNVLLIITDDQRLDGTMVMLPKTRQVFEQGGTTYSQAYVTSPLCCPSRGSIMTGQYVHNNNVSTNRSANFLDWRHTLQRSLRNAGYFTGIFGKFLNAWSDFRNPDDFDRWTLFDGGYFGFRVNEQGTVKPIPQYSTDYVRDRALGFLQESETNDSQPWFLMVTPVAPHLPATPEVDYENATIPDFVPNPATWEADRTDKPPWVQYSVPDQDNQDLVLANRESQLRTLPSVDDMVEALFNQLQASGETNTLAVFTSDNGYMWGEHNLDAKPRPYLDSVRVPMYMRWPGQVPAGATDNRLVANVDLAPTVSAATGVSLGGQTDGRNLLDSGWSRDRLLTEMAYQGNVPAWAALVTPSSHYIESYGNVNPRSIAFREYYDLTSDPYELDNLLSDANASNDPNVAALSAQLAEDRVCAGTSCP